MKRDTNFEVKATSRWVLGDGYNPREAEDPTLRPSTMEEVQGSRFFIIRHIHNHTSIISSEMQVELKKNTAFT